VLFNTRGGGVSFDELLAQSDIISIHAPLTEETRHAFGPAELLRMKRGALLINTARGPIVDEAALVAALEAGHLGGAALDVFENEPAVHQGLMGRDDVVLLPHLGSATQETPQIALSEVERVLRGEKPLHAVNEVR
jgi:glyoxylate reductase